MDETTRDQVMQDYLDGKLDKVAKLKFEKELEENPILAKEVREIQSLELNLQGIGAEKFRQNIANWESEYQEANKKQTPVISLWSYSGIAASLSLIIVAGYLFLKFNQEDVDLYAQNFTPYEDMVLSRGDQSDNQAKMLLSAGMEAYNKGEYIEASENLNNYLNEAPQDFGIALYLGISQMEEGNFEEAETSFNSAKKSQKFKQQAQWYAALLYLKSNQTQKLKSSLREISENNNHYKKKKAKELLEKID